MNGPDKCPDARDPSALLAYLQDEISPEERTELEEHLGRCPFCRAELTALRSVDLLLRSHPESFHPGADELYAFVAEAKDHDALIAKHLESCPDCSRDAGILREELFETPSPGRVRTPRELPASLAARLEEMHGIRGSKRPRLPLAARMADLFRLPFRVPVLALGSAAAVVLLAVMVIPTWETTKEQITPSKSDLSEESKSVDGGLLQSLADKDHRMPDHLVSREDRLGYVLEKPKTSPAELEVVPRGPLGGSERREERPPAEAKFEADSAAEVPAPGPAPSAPEQALQAPQARAMRKAPASSEVESSVMGRSEPALTVAQKAAPPVEAPMAGSEARSRTTGTMAARIPVEVSLVGSDGRPFAELRFTPPRGLEDRYRFLPEPPVPPKERKQIASSLRQAPAKGLDAPVPALRILIVIEKGRKGFNIRGTLSASGSGSASAVATDADVRPDDLRERVEALIAGLLSGHP